MIKAGLTGGIGAGKTLISEIFLHLGVPVFNADTEAGKILDEDNEVRTQLIEWFGKDAYKQGKPDRKLLAGILFSDPDMLNRMNRLIHPRVGDQFARWCSIHQQKPYVIHEAAILFESGLYRQLDTTILVTAPEEIRITRVIERDKTTEESIRLRMSYQWSDEQKIPLAGYIIENSGVTPVLPKILEIHNQLIG